MGPASYRGGMSNENDNPQRLKKVYEDCWGLFVENDEGETNLCLVPGTGVAAVYSQAYSMVPAQIATERNRDAAGTGFNWSARRVRVTVEEV